MCVHRKTETLKYRHDYYGDHLGNFRGQSVRCKSCGEIIKSIIQTPYGVQISNGSARVTVPYNGRSSSDLKNKH